MTDSTVPVPPAPELASSPVLQGERVTFTGTLASMTHRQGAEQVVRHGGQPSQHVSKQTTMLVVGEEGWPLEADGQPSQKLVQSQELCERGFPLRILQESEWLHLLGLEERRSELNRLYTPAMLAQMFDVSVGTIRSWERSGLIHAARKVGRLPYFEYREVVGARRLSQLLAAGISRPALEAAISKLRELLPGLENPAAQLDILARDSHVIVRDEHGLIEPVSRQREFDFDRSAENATDDQQTSTNSAHLSDEDSRSEDSGPVATVPLHPARWTEARRRRGEAVQTSVIPPRDAQTWFDEGCRFLAANQPESAIEAFRLCLMERSGDVECQFHLAEALYRGGNLRGALERYFAAVEGDPDYLEAWTQIGCLHAELGEGEAAVESFRLALSVHEDYPDAHFHLAETLHQLGREAEALPHWQSYLTHDQRGPWAELARQRLGIATAER